MCNAWWSKILLQKKISVFVLLLFTSVCFSIEVPIYHFSIKPYSQNINDHLPQDDADHSSPLLKPEYQAYQLHQFFNHYYSSDSSGLSPWSERLVRAVVPVVKKIELEILDDFDNQNKEASSRHYAENFKEHDEIWLNNLKQNMDLSGLDTNEFIAKNKAIAVANTFARALPETAPDFYHLSIPGQGFPFDNLQESVIWSGTPLYVISVSKDKAWSLVLTPDVYFAWVKSSDIAYASGGFISQWQTAAKEGLIAITETDTSIINRHHQFQFTGYIGAVFPLAHTGDNTLSILIPIKNEHHQAVITLGMVNKKSASLMPLLASKKNIATVLKQLQNRPYGWGGAFHFNDCSQEIKSLFTPFGIWLPRNSAKQSGLGASLDLSKMNTDERIKTLQEKGHPLMTLIYIGGHVMLYIGNKAGANHEVEAMTYQNVWGLSPENKDKRYVIGQALFLPLLKNYPENPDISSLASKSIFKLVFLDELKEQTPSLELFVRRFTKTSHAEVL
jgi:hypothetical protein